MRVVFACEDAGGARALAPVSRVIESKGVDVQWLVAPVARGILEDEGCAVSEVFSTEGDVNRLEHNGALFDPASIVVTASTCWGLRLEARCVLQARAMGCPTLTFVDFWTNYARRLSYPSTCDLRAVADRVLVIDETMAQDLENIGVPRHIVEVTGSPAFDILLSAQVPVLCDSDSAILFLSQPFSVLDAADGDERGYSERSVLEQLAGIASELRVRLVVRPHPREDAAALRHFVQELPCESALDDERDLRRSLRQARVVVGMTTMALVEAALLGKRVISAQLGRRGPDPLPTNRTGLTVLVEDVSALHSELERALTSSDEVPAERRRLAERGPSAPRVAELIEKYARRTSVR